MTFEWGSIEEIENTLGVSTADGDLREIRRLLRARLKDVHPDTHQGEFGSDLDESEFHKIKSAIEYVDKRLLTGLPVQNQQALLVANQFSEAIVTTLAESRNQDRDLERQRQLQEKQRQTSEEIALEVRKKFRFYKIVSGVIAVFFGFLTIFPEKFAGNPVFITFSEIVEKLDFTLGVLFLYLFIAGALAIVYLWWEEQRELKRKKECLSDKGIEQIVKSKSFEGKLGPLGKFTRADLIDALEEQRISGDQNTLNEVAGLIIDKLILRGAAKKVEKPSLNEIYEMDFGIYLEIRPDKI
jgi:hypothetical protein